MIELRTSRSTFQNKAISPFFASNFLCSVERSHTPDLRSKHRSDVPGTYKLFTGKRVGMEYKVVCVVSVGLYTAVQGHIRKRYGSTYMYYVLYVYVFIRIIW